MKIIHNELDGRKVAYTSETVFKIQLGKDKSSYKTIRTITGSLSQAVMHYNMLNIGNGYKKRLICEEFNTPLLARQFSVA